MKKLTKILTAITLVLVMLFTSACSATRVKPGSTNVNEGEENEASTPEDDKNKTHLTVAVFDGGLGTDWVTEAGKRFEKACADISFEEGKKGVKVSVVKGSTWAGGAILDTLQTEQADVWYTESVIPSEHIAKGNFAEITDAVTEDLSEYGEKESIEDKMSETHRDYLNFGTKNEPKYYAVPFNDSFYGMWYDKGFFADNNLYFKSTGTEKGDAADDIPFVSSKSDKKAAGADGKLGTYDDGLPATYAQLLRLMDKMVENDITPLIYAGGNAMSYITTMMANFWASAEGAEGAAMHFSLDGTASNLVKLDANGKIVKNADGTPKLETLKITQTNGYELQRQESFYQVLELFEKITANEKYYSESNLMHTVAMSNFLKGKHEKFKTYGMIMEGNWWYNESKESFKILSDLYGDEYKGEKREFGLMPYPAPTSADVGRKHTILNQSNTLGFIRSTTKVLDCAKAFLRFTNTDAELSAFTASVGMTRSLDYEITKEYADKLTPFAKTMVEIKKASDMVYPYSGSDFYHANGNAFFIYNWAWKTQIGNSNYGSPWQLWITRRGKYTAEQYFAGMYQYWNANWPRS